MLKLLRLLFYHGFVKLIVTLLLGLNVRHRERLPKQGPAIIVANHNSHLDTMVLMTLLPAKLLPITQPVAAMDYFLKNRLLAWFTLNIIGILPIQRQRDKTTDPLQGCYQALDKGRILVLFPEGSRGQPEVFADFKWGIAKLAERFPGVPVIPVFLHGLGKALPKGEALLVPFFCDVFIGEPLFWNGDRAVFMQQLQTSITQLAGDGKFPLWD
jgi:1-acyl-sn-glycerol-3-phosphate acyltransferase